MSITFRSNRRRQARAFDTILMRQPLLDRVEAVRVNNNRIEVSRPLCAYHQVAVYNGRGEDERRGQLQL